MPHNEKPTINVEISHKLLDKIMNGMDCTKMNMWEIIKHVYEATFMYHELRFAQEHNLRKKYEAKIVEKVGVITAIEDDLKEYQQKYGPLRESVPTEAEEETEGTAKVLSLHQGSKES